MDDALRRGAEDQARQHPINAALEQSKTTPSRGAEVDAQLMKEDQEMTSKKGSFGPNV